MRIILFLISFSFTTICFGQLKVAQIFSDDMVLQADSPIPIWGEAYPNSTVEVFINKQCIKGKADGHGKWKIVTPSKKAGATATIKITNKSESLTISNIIYGDVWLCGGQSNMEWYVEGADNAEQEIKNANHPNIRLFDVPRNLSNVPADDLPSGEWAVCSSTSIPQFSAVGYYFGKAMYQHLDRPIGLLSDNYGGTIAEAWTSEESLNDIPYFKEVVTTFKNTNIEEAKKTGDIAFNKWLSKFHVDDEGIMDSTYIWSNIDVGDWKTMSLPTLWEASADPTLHEKDGVVWFSREFEVQNISDAVVNLGPIDDSDITWVNGHRIGETYNQYNKDRSYQIDKKHLKVGNNRITIRVEDYIGGGGIYGKSEKLFIQLGDKKISLSGLWNYKKGMIVSDPMPSNSFSPNNFPTCLFNGMIAPITDFPIKGVIWYQGESNSYRAYEYRTLFPMLINDWRRHWNQPELPFIYVQLANFKEQQSVPQKSEWAELRDAQSMTLDLDNTAMITAIDLGEAENIHPTNKQEVGKRLAAAAMTEVYNVPTPYKGPTFLNQEVDHNSIIITFENVDTGLQVDNKFGYVFGFTIAGNDKKYKWAKAEIIAKNKVRVWHHGIANPISVRYAWQDNPDPANLTNGNLLPAFPFRTDTYQISTFEINRF